MMTEFSTVAGSYDAADEELLEEVLEEDDGIDEAGDEEEGAGLPQAESKNIAERGNTHGVFLCICTPLWKRRPQQAAPSLIIRVRRWILPSF